jgi:adenosylcobinamide-GDP ribazoletransferase
MADGSTARTTLRDGLRMALGTLTAVPVPVPGTVDARIGATAMVLGPVAGLVPGVAAAGIAGAASAVGLGSLAAAALAVGAVALSTRGVHLDGLADTADGLAASYDRQRALAVMRTGDVGPAGVSALVLVLLVQVAAAAQTLSEHPGAAGPAALTLAVVAGRAVLAPMCMRGIPAARPDGLGAAVAGNVPRPAAVAVTVVVAIAAAGLGTASGLTWWRGPLAIAAALAAAALVVTRAVRRVGGTTGDVLGAAVEAGTSAALLTFAA